MSNLYDRADIYDLIDSDQRTDTIRRDWKEFLGRDVKSFASSPSDMQRLVEALSLAAGPAGSLVP